MRRLTRWMPSLFVCALFLSARAVHAQGIEDWIDQVNKAIIKIEVIARKHQLEINKAKMLPEVGTLQDSTDRLRINNEVLQSSIDSALSRTPNGMRVLDAYAGRIVSNASAVNAQNISLGASLADVSVNLKYVQGLKDAPYLSEKEKADVAEAMNTLQMQGQIMVKERIINDIQEDFGTSRQPLTQARRSVIRAKMSRAIQIIQKVVTNIHSLYKLLDS